MSTALFDRHRERFERARRACRERGYWTPFPDGQSIAEIGLRGYRVRPVERP